MISAPSALLCALPRAEIRLLWLNHYRLGENGGDEGDRTPNLRIANAALSQLSYIPTMIVTLKYITQA